MARKKATKKKRKKSSTRRTRGRANSTKRKAAVRGRATRRKAGSRKKSRATVSQRGGTGKGGRPPAKVITISYDANQTPPIRVHKEHENIMVTSDGVIWESKDYEYRTVFQGQSPFNSDKFDGIKPNSAKGSGKPRAGSNGPNPYKYMVIRVGTGEHLDPTIKVDP